MWRVPERLWVTSGAAEGGTPLNAFDNALLAAEIGNYNLIKVSSIIPQGARLQEVQPDLLAGALVPAVVAHLGSDQPGVEISSAVGLGFGRDSHGMIMEHSCIGPAERAEAEVRKMVEQAFARRGMDLHAVVIRSCSHRVVNVGCTVAAVILW